ncbi:hypothetical protein F4803DRAFT_263300 [Xylaria telfairii]|nr:hypothetical protein F4803DRAFT_263300 [Xylaria telfairii]
MLGPRSERGEEEETDEGGGSEKVQVLKPASQSQSVSQLSVLSMQEPVLVGRDTDTLAGPGCLLFLLLSAKEGPAPVYLPTRCPLLLTYSICSRREVPSYFHAYVHNLRDRCGTGWLVLVGKRGRWAVGGQVSGSRVSGVDGWFLFKMMGNSVELASLEGGMLPRPLYGFLPATGVAKRPCLFRCATYRLCMHQTPAPNNPLKPSLKHIIHSPRYQAHWQLGIS